MSILVTADYDNAEADGAEIFLSHGNVIELLRHLMLPPHDIIQDPPAVEKACVDFIAFYDGKTMSDRDHAQHIPWFLTQAGTLLHIARKAIENGATRILIDDGTVEFGPD